MTAPTLHMPSVSVGPLQAIITPAIPAADVKYSVVLLHGYGAPGTDLVGLAREIDAPHGTQFIFLQAPHQVEGMGGGRAWWHIDMMALQMARFTGQHDEMAKRTPEGIDEARSALGEALEVLSKSHGLVWEKTLVGGFSQGAMLSCDWALRGDKPLAGLVLLSGTVLSEAEWRNAMNSRVGLPTFQSHSPDDQVLPFQLAERLRDAMSDAGMKVEFTSFAGGHGISREVLSRLSSFVKKAFL